MKGSSMGRATRRALRSTAGGNYAHPHYWGAFTLFGGIPHQQAVSLPPAAGAGWRRPLLWLGAAVLAFAGFRLLPRQQRGVRLR